MSLIRPGVIAAWTAFSEPLEGRVPHMYLDILGLVTCGVGNLIDPVWLALQLPWQRPDGTLATPAEVKADWHAVKSQPGLAKLHWREAGKVTRLRLSEASIDAQVSAKREVNARHLQRSYFPDLADWPADAQLATFSMAWAMGPDFPRKFPLWSAAARARRWDLCAARGKMRETGNPGVVPRNALNAAHFQEACSDLAQEYPDLLFGPCTLDALRAGWEPSKPYRASAWRIAHAA